MNNPMFEVNESDVASLSDELLSDLIARLCKADLTQAGQSTRCVKHGGNINTPDSGLDIVVEWEIDPPACSHLPRKTTGIQVKKSDMPKSKIIKEMDANIGNEKSINWLVNKSGCYIIVSSGQSCNYRQIRDRQDVMRERVTNVLNNENLRLEFYDTQAIVDWVNQYPGVVIWVRNTVGRPFSGWQPYGDWASSGSINKYILDDEIRFMFDFSDCGTTVFDGIQRIREQLSTPGSAVRLVGLSGVGKTRLVQALFESSVGDNPLAEHLACYTDLADNPIPDAVELVRIIKANNQRIILIVDNCSPELHNTLVKNLKGGQLSLITIEYDVKEDQPSNTRVFLLEPASNTVLKRVLTTRHPGLDDNVLDRIVELSAGNSRVALALVENYYDFGDFGTLRDDEIFRRLFWQQNIESRDLLDTAQACSLVFSFNNSDPGEIQSEIPLLALLRDQTPQEFFRNISDIKKRKLLQSRGSMSAILPQAVANSIAADALESFTQNALDSVFVEPRSDRLLRSFCHRLSFLHHCRSARRIAETWLSPTGLFGCKGLLLNEQERKCVSYILPIDFSLSLDYLKMLVNNFDSSPVKALSPSIVNWITRSLLMLLHFDENFTEGMELIERIILNENLPSLPEAGLIEQTHHLFWSQYSRTLTTPKSRFEHISHLLESNNEKENSLGIKLLDATLQTQFNPVLWLPEFGARSLTLGYRVQTIEEVEAWFILSLQTLVIAHRNNPRLRNSLRLIVEDKFWYIWKSGILCDEFVDLVKEFIEGKPWPELWIPIRKAMYQNKGGFGGRRLVVLETLEKMVRPNSLSEELAVFLHRSDNISFMLEGDSVIETRESKINAHYSKMSSLGEKVSKDLKVLSEVGSALFMYQNYWIDPFIESVTLNTDNLCLLWETLRDNYKLAPSGKLSTILITFFRVLQTKDPVLACNLRREVSEDQDLCHIFPSITIFNPDISSDVNNLINLIQNGVVSPRAFYGYGNLEIGNQISATDFCKLITALGTTKEGFGVAIQIVEGKIDAYQKENRSIPTTILQLSKNMLFKSNDPQFNDINDDMRDLYLTNIFALLSEKSLSSAEVRRFIGGLFPEGFEDSIYSNRNPSLTRILCLEHPYALLDTLFSRIGKIDPVENFALLNCPESIGEIFQNVAEETILAWLEKDLIERAKFLSRYLLLVEVDKNTGVMRWTAFGKLFLSKTSTIPTVLDNVALRLEPRSPIGSFSLTYAKYLPLFDHNDFTTSAHLTNWCNLQRARWLKIIDMLKEDEDKTEKMRQETFEE